MDHSKWKRDAARVSSVLHEQKDGSVVTAKPAKIYIPKRFAEKNLAEIGTEVFILGIFAIVIEDSYYAVSNANAMIRIKPNIINTVKFGEDLYLEFVFEAGSTVIASTQLIVSDSLVYEIFDEFIAKGRVPWYCGYEDLARLFETSDYHAGLRLAHNHSILAMFAASITRDTKDRSKYYRHVIKDLKDLDTNPPTVIPQRSIVLGASNTLTRLVGSYWEDGLNSALANPSTELEPIEDLLLR